MSAMSQVILALISGLVGAVVGGAMTVWGSMKALNTTMNNLERAEIRRMKIECVVNLAGLRFLITDNRQGQIRPDADIAKLMFELNRVSTLWADDNEVLKNIRDFHAERSNTRLITLIRSLAKSTKLHLDNLSDADVSNVFEITRPFGLPSMPPKLS